MTTYNLDWHHVREHRDRPGGLPLGWDELSMDERWLRPTATEMAEREVASWTARFALVIEDLLALPASRPIVAEGPSAFPWCVASVIHSARQAIFLLPTREWRRAVLTRRHRDAPGEHSSAKTTDPERARRNIEERDVLLASRIVRSCDELGLGYAHVDGSSDLDETLALLEQQFQPHLPADLNV